MSRKRFWLMIFGGSFTGGVLGSLVGRFLDLAAFSVPGLALQIAAVLIGMALWSTLLFGWPWPVKADVDD